MKLAEMILAFRSKNNLTQAQMAEYCGLSVGTIVRLEDPDNKIRPNWKTLGRLLGGMGYTEELLMGLVTDDEMFQSSEFVEGFEYLMEEQLLKYYRQLRFEGKRIALSQVKALAGSEDLRKKQFNVDGANR